MSEIPPREIFVDESGELWEKYIHDEKYISLGIAPRPQTRLQAIIYHVCHGLIMRYPLLDILVWSWRNRDSFEDKIVNRGYEGSL